MPKSCNASSCCRVYFQHSEDVLASLENLAAVGVPELLEAEKNGCSSTYCTLTRSAQLFTIAHFFFFFHCTCPRLM